MTVRDLGTPEPAWRKSSFSNLADCVEVAPAGGQVLLRDSKRPAGTMLTLDARPWRTFLAAVGAGALDG